MYIYIYIYIHDIFWIYTLFSLSFDIAIVKICIFFCLDLHSFLNKCIVTKIGPGLVSWLNPIISIGALNTIWILSLNSSTKSNLLKCLPHMAVVRIKLENSGKTLHTVTGTCWVAQYISAPFILIIIIHSFPSSKLAVTLIFLMYISDSATLLIRIFLCIHISHNTYMYNLPSYTD